MNKNLANRWRNVKVLAQEKKEEKLKEKTEKPATITKIVNLSKDKGEIFRFNLALARLNL